MADEAESLADEPMYEAGVSLCRQCKGDLVMYNEELRCGFCGLREKVQQPAPRPRPLAFPPARQAHQPAGETPEAMLAALAEPQADSQGVEVRPSEGRRSRR